MRQVDRPVTRFEPARVGLAWLTAIGVDLFLNAGLFSSILDQSREPALLTDHQLALRIPVAFSALAVGVVGLAWLLGRLRAPRQHLLLVAGVVGAVVGVLGVGGLWTAIDITGAFVAAGIATSTAEATASAVVLTSPLPAPRLRLRVAVGFAVLAGLGQVLANLLSS